MQEACVKQIQNSSMYLIPTQWHSHDIFLSPSTLDLIKDKNHGHYQNQKRAKNNTFENKTIKH